MTCRGGGERERGKEERVAEIVALEKWDLLIDFIIGAARADICENIGLTRAMHGTQMASRTGRKFIRGAHARVV